MAYFAMFSTGSTKKASAETAKANMAKETVMEVEESAPKEIKEDKKALDSAVKPSNHSTPVKDDTKEHSVISVQSEEPTTIQRISNLSLVRYHFPYLY